MMLVHVPPAIANQSWRAIGIVTALAVVGALALYSMAGGSMVPWAGAHLLRFALFLILALVISYIPSEQFKPLLFPAYLASLALLIIVLMMGIVGGGARSWLNLGFMQLQPSEFVRLAVIGMVARFYEMLPPAATRSFTALWPPVALTVVPFALILLQPDLGTGMMLVLSVAVVTFLAGLPLRLYAAAGAAAIVLIPVIYSFLLPHQQRRVTIFMNPEADPLGAGYHITQSVIAIGSGGFFGKGYLQGSQSHLHYLPESHTDFIFPAITEEWGLLGATVIIALFWLLLLWGMNVARDAASRFDQLLAAGLTCSLFLYISINMMMVVGFAPVVGLPLPLVSYGGSAMLSIMISLGLLMGIDRKTRKRANPYLR
ncbi:rod shape determining protein RodA [Sphingobium sp. B2D3A]|uniref:rod shape-determining protein RodA n=1 Tax=unclassified Sphingobium TaxID=2611147 RepID=UPI002225B4D8|nr:MULTISPECIES: rod shape-determining protein RodA [unclassified Sphingobium]MCW2337345.1 rod shape determining protein RodA [Sphingobium sp. B2D3A]MCW2383803.1 rod shape determining protein RodA [Sphingobium sp. B2D3D]